MSSQTRVALGFECPLFIPLALNELDLTRARVGEGDRPWSAGAGCGALATGLVQVAWILTEIRKKREMDQAFLSWTDFSNAKEGLFLWEAFVSGAVKTKSHIEDAKAGAEAFRRALPNPSASNLISFDQNSDAIYSLIGAALLRTNWSSDSSLLSQPCVVIRADEN